MPEAQTDSNWQDVLDPEHRYRNFFRTSKDAAFITTRDGRWIDFNRAAVELFGYESREDLMKVAIPDLYADSSDREAHLQAIVEQGYTDRYPVDLRRRDGTVIHALITSVPIEDRDGTVVAFQGTITDVTEQQRITEALSQERNLLRGIVETSPVCIAVVDREGQIVFANREAEEVLGLEKDEITSRTYNDPDWRITDYEGEPFPEEQLPFAQVMRTGEPVSNVEHAIEWPDGHRVLLSISGAPLFDASGQIERVVFAIEDVTRRREMEVQLVQQERLAAVGQLAAGVAHDFRNMLASILLFAQMNLREPDLPQDVADDLRTIIEETQRAADLVQQLLDFSSQAMIEPRPLELASFLTELIDGVLRREIPENIKISLSRREAKGDAPFTIEGDPGRIRQAIVNLALNARDAMPEGGRLRFTLSPVEIQPEDGEPVPRVPPGDYVCLAVADTGTGMTQEVLDHLFEPFFTTKDVGKGRGLGLAQVYGIVRQHEGYIDVDTELGEGSEFRIYLPRAGEPSTEERAEADAAPPQGRGETILLAEDAERLRKALQSALESLNYRVLTATDGREALEVAAREDVELVLTDIEMPDMGGEALLEALQAREPQLKVVAITGHALDTATDTGPHAGFADHIEKPFSVQDLAAVVRATLDRTDA